MNANTKNDPVWAVEQTTAEPARYRFKHDRPLLFTTSKWNALSHISGYHVAVEGPAVNLEVVFPDRVVRAVAYGVLNAGLSCRAVEYVSGEGKPLGAVLFLAGGVGGNRLLGCYALRYANE